MFTLKTFRNLSKINVFNTSNVRKKHSLAQLNDRVLIKLRGRDVPDYLQGLITNDINHLSKDNSSQYTMFLNTKGRVFCDSIIYRFDPETYFIECDSSLSPQMEKHLKMYRLKKNVDVIPSEIKVYVLYENIVDGLVSNKGNTDDLKLNSKLDATITVDKISVFKDPRVSYLGCRVFSLENIDVKQELPKNLPFIVNEEDSSNYRKLRYCLGIGEGLNDLPIGNCFPLENNCDFLHGISFHKGCYIGQELTARTYHTGVIRKRLLPLYFEKDIENFSSDQISIDGNRIGKVKGVIGNVGLGLIRLDLLENLKKLQFNDVNLVVGKPSWWPFEAPRREVASK